LHKAHHQQNIPNPIFWFEQRAINKTFDQDDALLYENLLEVDDQLRENANTTYERNTQDKCYTPM
jgi:hypothetical protein